MTIEKQTMTHGAGSQKFIAPEIINEEEQYNEKLMSTHSVSLSTSEDQDRWHLEREEGRNPFLIHGIFKEYDQQLLELWNERRPKFRNDCWIEGEEPLWPCRSEPNWSQKRWIIR